MMWTKLKRWLKLVGITLGGFLLLFAAALWWLRDGVVPYVESEVKEYKSRALTEALNTQVKNLPKVDSVKVWRLSGSATTPGESPFTKDIYGRELYAAQVKELLGPPAEQLAALWRKQSVFSNGVMCHEPHHAVVFYLQGKEVGRAQICFKCMNAAIPSSILGDALIGFDSFSAEYAALKSLIESLVGAAP